MEADLVSRAGVPFKAIPAAGIHGVGVKAIGSLVTLARGFFAARRLIREFRPDVLFFTGGYVAVPTGLAGRRIPTLLCLPDIEPGLALKTLARFADHITVPADESRQFFPRSRQITVTGYPTRPDLKPWERAKAFEVFDLSPKRPTLLVTGGSLGARSINRAVVDALPAWLPRMQVIHLAGKATWPEVEAAQKNLPADLASAYRPYPYLYNRMAAAFTAADLVVSRAGASILGELPAFGLPAVLVPYPHAWRYQKVNAEYLVNRGAAYLLRDEDLGRDLSAVVQNLIHNTAGRAQMSAAMASLARPQAAASIAALLRQLAFDKDRSPARGGAA